MLAYPSIPAAMKSRHLGKDCMAFYKYDGSNLRWEWSPKRSWYKYGSRTQLFDESSEQFKDAIPLFKNGMADDIVSAITKEFGKTERIVAFTEYFGPSSFAGWHDPTEQKDMVLIDVSVYKKGFLLPQQFVNLFGQQTWAAKHIYSGPMDEGFVMSVRHSTPTSEYHVNEGVVCKGDTWNAKIKTFAYLNKLKNRFGDDWEKYGE